MARKFGDKPDGKTNDIDFDIVATPTRFSGPKPAIPAAIKDALDEIGKRLDALGSNQKVLADRIAAVDAIIKTHFKGMI